MKSIDIRFNRSLRRALLVSTIAVTAIAMAIIAICLARAFTTQSRQLSVQVPPPLALDAGHQSRLADALRLRTISTVDSSPSSRDEFSKFREYVERVFPNVFRTLRRIPTSGDTLAYIWESRDGQLEPIILLAHQDVVPVERDIERGWKHDPFGGVIADGYVWGRGAIDNKGALIGILQAMEILMMEHFAPSRSIILVFSADEEIRGEGARQVADMLEAQKVRAHFVLDEGLFIARNVVPGIEGNVALVGVQEKGFLRLELSVHAAGGHVATGGADSAVARLSAAIAALQRSPLPASIAGTPQEFFEWLAPEMPLGGRLVAENLWLFAPVIEARMRNDPRLDALIRTAMASTIVQGGTRFNVMPRDARATAIFFVRPGDATVDVLHHVRVTIGEGVEVRVVEAMEPSVKSPTDSASFEVLQRTIGETFPGTLVAPSLLVGNVDARHYTRISDHVFRFTPIVLTRDELAGIHGNDERLSLAGYADIIRFYHRLIKNAGGADGMVSSRQSWR